MQINNTIDDISIEVAKELGTDPYSTKIVNRIQWRFLMETMQSGTLEPVQLIYIGKFIKNKKYKDGKRYKGNLQGIQEPNL